MTRVDPGREPPSRGSVAHILSLYDHGKWFEPPYWTEAGFTGGAPWDASLIARAYGEARRIFTADRTLAIVSEWLEAVTNPKPVTSADWSPVFSLKPLFGVLLDRARAKGSELLALGLDALHLSPDQDDLRRRLAIEKEYLGARFELAIHAALVRAEIPFRPARKKTATKEPNPDFVLELGGRPFFLEAKSLQPSAEAREFAKLYWRLLMGPKGDDMFDGSFDFLPAFWPLLKVEHGWKALEARFEELATKMRCAHDRLAGEPEGTKEEIDGILVVTAGRPTSLRYPFIPLAEEAEPSRLIEKFPEYVKRIPKDEIGAFAVRMDTGVDPVDMELAIREWFSTLESPRNVVGVLLIRDPDVTAGTNWIRPVWRASTPPEVANIAVWQAFANGYNWRALCVRRSRSES